jgi:hypothetical protein
MAVSGCSPKYDVEIRSPKSGSGYRIGGSLVLTAAHLFDGLGPCQVRSQAGFGLVEAKVVWIAEGVDIALVELPDSAGGAPPVAFGRLPDDSAILDIEFYCWPKWGCTETDEGSGPGRRHIQGTIDLGDSSHEGLLVLEPKRSPEVISKTESAWAGSSGAVVFCQGYVVGVQSQHQNPLRPQSLEAAPIAKILEDSKWCKLLKEQGISVKPKKVKSTLGQAVPKVSKSRLKSVKTTRPKQNVIDLFWKLDYREQERVFEALVEEQDKCIASSIVAPCNMTQNWIVKRLIQHLPNYENAVQYTIDLNRMVVIEDLWEDCAKQLKIKPDKNEVLQALCHPEIVRPVVILILNARDAGVLQKKMLKEFVEPLVEKAQKESRRSLRSRLAIFVVDKSHPSHDSVLARLTPLDEIPQKDVERWLAGDSVHKWCREVRGGEIHEIVSDLTTGGWNWENPSSVIEKMYGMLRSEYDEDVQDVLKWAS